MTRTVLANGLYVTEPGLREREALSCLPARLLWLIAGTFTAAVLIDTTSKPQLAATMLLIAGACVGSVAEAILNLYVRAKLSNETHGPMVISAKLTSSANAACLLTIAAILFGDAALANVGAGTGAVIGSLLGMLASFQARLPKVLVHKPKKERRAWSLSERFLVSIHECGHALTTAFLSKADREGSYIQIGDNASTCTWIPTPEGGLTAKRLRWEMFMLLGGAVAEEVHFGSPTDLCHRDMKEFREKAMALMTAERTAGWNGAPQNETESMQNQVLIKKLDDEFSEALREFLGANKDLLAFMAGIVNEDNGMMNEDFEEFVKSAAITPLASKLLG